jgi:hypothetical protein
VSLALLIKHLRIRMGNALSQVPNGIELIWMLREDSIYLICLGVKSFALVLNEMFGMLG